MVKILPANVEATGDVDLILGREEPLEEEIHSSILARIIPWSEESGRPQSMWS